MKSKDIVVGEAYLATPHRASAGVHHGVANYPPGSGAKVIVRAVGIQRPGESRRDGARIEALSQAESDYASIRGGERVIPLSWIKRKWLPEDEEMLLAMRREKERRVSLRAWLDYYGLSPSTVIGGRMEKASQVTVRIRGLARLLRVLEDVSPDVASMVRLAVAVERGAESSLVPSTDLAREVLAAMTGDRETAR